MAGEASEAVARGARTPPDSLGGHVDPWGPCAPRGGAGTRRDRPGTEKSPPLLGSVRRRQATRRWRQLLLLGYAAAGELGH